MQIIVGKPRGARRLLLGRDGLVGTFKPLINRSGVAWRLVHAERRQKHNRRAHEKADDGRLYLLLAHRTPTSE